MGLLRWSSRGLPLIAGFYPGSLGGGGHCFVGVACGFA